MIHVEIELLVMRARARLPAFNKVGRLQATSSRAQSPLMAKTLPSSYLLTLTYDSALFLPFFSDYFVSIKSLCSSRDRTSPNKLFLSEDQSIVF